MPLRALVLMALISALASACHRVGSCEPFDATGLKTGCSGPQGYMWNGSACVFTQACNCTGNDCQGLYQERETCETAHTHCVK